jgi:hypothetical protein
LGRRTQPEGQGLKGGPPPSDYFWADRGNPDVAQFPITVGKRRLRKLARAADSILDHSAKAIELEDIEARVAELERAAEASKGNR